MARAAKPLGQYICTYCGKKFERPTYKGPNTKNKFCGKTCQGAFLTIPALDRLWTKIDKRGPDECWPWMGYRDPNGYGRIMNKTGTKLPTRLVMEYVMGKPVPDDLHVLHTCDNPPCCNPKHLWLGNDADNTRDKMRKRRHCRHEQRPRAKLTMAKAREIRAATGSLREIAKAFGVGQTVVSNIRHGRAWKEDFVIPIDTLLLVI